MIRLEDMSREELLEVIRMKDALMKELKEEIRCWQQLVSPMCCFDLQRLPCWMRLPVHHLDLAAIGCTSLVGLAPRPPIPAKVSSAAWLRPRHRLWRL